MIRRKPHLRRSTDHSTWLRGSDRIAAALGVNRNQLPELVEKHRLPAFKYLGRWTLLTSDLPEWMRYIKNHHTQRPANSSKRHKTAPPGRRSPIR